MDIEPSRLNKRKNPIMDSTVIRYAFHKRSRKSIDSNTSSLSSFLNHELWVQASHVSIFSDVDLPDSGQSNTIIDISSGFMVFTNGSFGFISFSPTKVGNRPILPLNLDSTKRAANSVLFR